jgi:hypothetical protein
MAIGGTVTDGTAGRVLYVGAGPVLAQADLTITPTGAIITGTGGSGERPANTIILANSGFSGTSQYSIAIGHSPNIGSAGFAVAIGYLCSATNSQSFAFGDTSTASGNKSLAMGVDQSATAANSMAIGYSANVAGHRGMSFGEFANTDAAGDVVLGVAGSAPFVKLKSNSSTTNGRHVGGIRSAWVDSTDATRTGRIDLGAYSTSTFQPGFRAEGDSGGVKTAVNGATAVAKQTVTGSRGGNAALASLLTALATWGVITDSTTA